MRQSRGILFAWTIVIALSEATYPTINWAAGPSRPAEMQKRDQWLKDRLLSTASMVAEQGSPAFSFVYGERPSDELLAAWPRTGQSRKLSKDRTQHTLTFTDAKTGLQVRCVAVEYADFPVVEWTVYFKNTGQHDTPILANLQAIDTRIERAPEGEFLLKYNKGDTCAPDLYQPLEQALTPRAQLRLAPAGGRGTNQAFPYYNLSMPGGGLIMAVGWPGQWATTFSRDAARGLRIVAGQEVTHLILRPGEEVRTPLVALLFWEGADAQRAQNLWRRWMIAHNLPRTADDKLPSPIMPGNTSGEFNEMCNATEKDENQFIDRYVEERIPIDYWWMDAGWYPCNGWPQTGTWEPDLKRFPKGLRAISDHARAKGIKTLVWFEPERVAGGTWLAENHPEWLLGGTLLNLGNTAARTWLTDHTDKVLREQGIDLYRQDFNMDPLDFWRRNDPPDRQGITENFHVQGYLAYWDALRRRHPNLRIDSCASGGRRNDLETMRRAVPLHPTDYNYGHLAVKQAFHQSLFQWIPFFGSNTVPCDTVDAYAIRSGHAMSIVLGYDLRRSDLDYALLRKLTNEARRVAPYYYSDYYPLTPYTVSEDAWIAWQFNEAETEDGLVEAFRRPRSQEASISLKLRGLDAQAVYEIQNADLEGLTRATGRDLMEKGLLVSATRHPQAVLLTYKRVRGLAAVIAAGKLVCEVLEPITFSAAGSYGPNSEIAAYRWDFSDSAISEGPSVEHAYNTPGSYPVKLTVTDRLGATDSTCVTIAVSPVDTTPPAIVAVASGEPDKVGVVFNKPIERASAENVSNFSIDRGVHVLSASLATDLLTVTLRTSPLSKGTSYLLTVNHIRDRARTPKTVAPNAQSLFQYRGMYGWWRLDDGKGDVAIDCSGNGHHGMLQGAHGGPAWKKDARGMVLSFDGIDSYVETGTFLPELTMPFSISLWVNPAPTQTVHADILGNHGEPFVGINLQQDATNTNCFGFGFGNGRKWQGSGSAPLKAGQWQHLAVVCDGESSILYLNGLEKSKGPGKGPLAANPGQNFKLGQGYHSGRYFHGLLSDVRIFREALSAAEVAALAKDHFGNGDGGHPSGIGSGAEPSADAPQFNPIKEVRAAKAGRAATDPVYPLKVSANGRYLVDQNNTPYLLAGDSTQALTTNISTADAEMFFADRHAHGFNADWVNLLTAGPNMAGRNDGSTYDGIRPFTGYLSGGTDWTHYDLTKPNEAFFERVDQMIRLAAKHKILVILDPAETIAWLPALLNNGPARCRAYGQYLGNRYKAFDNILWMSGNDFARWQDPKCDAVVMAVALGIKDKDTRHLQTIEVQLQVAQNLSSDDPKWAAFVSLNAAYCYGPPYIQVLRGYNYAARTMPVFMVEAVYEFEGNAQPKTSTPCTLRRQEYWSILSGATGQLYGNGYTWPFKPGWKEHLDTPGAAQMVFLKSFFESQPWYKLVPDQAHTTLTAGYGTRITEKNFTGGIDSNDYVTAARTEDGALVVAYLPSRRTVTIDMTRLSGPAIARWFDPSNGAYTAVAGSPLANTGSRNFTPPGNNHDGDGDWVLVVNTMFSKTGAAERRW